jgi:hypothetical protein
VPGVVKLPFEFFWIETVYSGTGFLGIPFDMAKIIPSFKT